MTPVVSVVVPTYQRPELLHRCLTALLEQELPPSSFEIIVADDAGSDATKTLVDELPRVGVDGAAEEVPEPIKPVGSIRPAERACVDHGPAVRYVRVSDHHGPAAARNQGWRVARAPIVAFTDDDCIPRSTWLRAGLSAFTEDVVGVSGRLVMPLPAHPTDYERDAAGLQRAPFVTANCFYRRDALAAIGGFDERFTAPWREDSDVYLSLLERGATLISEPDAVVEHPIRPAPWGISLHQQPKSQFNALLFKKHPALFHRHVQGVPWRYYATLTALFGCVLLAAGRRPLPAVRAAGVWLGLTGCFCAERLGGTTHRRSHVVEMMITSALIPPLSLFWRTVGAIRFRTLFF